MVVRHIPRNTRDSSVVGGSPHAGIPQPGPGEPATHRFDNAPPNMLRQSPKLVGVVRIVAEAHDSKQLGLRHERDGHFDQTPGFYSRSGDNWLARRKFGRVATERAKLLWRPRRSEATRTLTAVSGILADMR